jgi:hypothetical protein
MWRRSFDFLVPKVVCVYRQVTFWIQPAGGSTCKERIPCDSRPSEVQGIKARTLMLSFPEWLLT